MVDEARDFVLPAWQYLMLVASVGLKPQLQQLAQERGQELEQLPGTTLQTEKETHLLGLRLHGVEVC